MKAIVIIEYPQLRKLYSVRGIIYNNLVKMEEIDTDYYDVTINKVEHFLSSSSMSYKFYVEYSLKRNPIWDTLEEVEERLKIGM